MERKFLPLFNGNGRFWRSRVTEHDAARIGVDPAEQLPFTIWV
jgi:hypothetical protein